MVAFVQLFKDMTIRIVATSCELKTWMGTAVTEHLKLILVK